MHLSEMHKLSPSEAVFGFAAWLTCRDTQIKFSAKDDAAPAAEVASKFCKTNKLKTPRDRWEKALTHPKE